MTTEQAIAQKMFERLQGIATDFQAFGDPLTIDDTGTVRTQDGSPVWEFENEEDYKGKTAEELGHEIEAIFWHDRDMMLHQND